ncbi:hypothetical protein R1sor_025497 [Riccia sorocarpa]|uniref:Protein kinase domain-containing protein n=1 Tax=Riccia sorocarpa TaxID=122646 RepID=A0ABD3GCQ3_9MARC
MLKESDRHDNKDIDPEGRRIMKKLVFVGIGDLGWAQTKDQTDNETFKPYPVGDRDPRAWVAPELTREKACPDWHGRKYITFFSESTDIYAMGYILENLCGDFFSDMTPRERSAYDDEMFAKGFPTGASLPHVVHGQRLRKALDTMTTRPPETKPRQKKHPDGPREIGKGKL